MPAKKVKPAAAAPIDPFAWIKWVALSTTLFAVCAAIASIKSGGYSGKIAIMLGSIASLMKQKQLWYAGMAIGGVGLVYMVVGAAALSPISDWNNRPGGA